MPDMRDFEPTLLEYTYELRGEGRAAGTIGNYTRTLTTWATWLADQDDAPDVIADVRKEHITRWLAGRQKSEAPETVLTRYRHLRARFSSGPNGPRLSPVPRCSP